MGIVSMGAGLSGFSLPHRLFFKTRMKRADRILRISLQNCQNPRLFLIETTISINAKDFWLFLYRLEGKNPVELV
jgi:hypothetical protein